MQVRISAIRNLLNSWPKAYFSHCDRADWPDVRATLELYRCRWAAVVIFGSGVRVFSDDLQLAAIVGRAQVLLPGTAALLLQGGDLEHVEADEKTAADLCRVQASEFSPELVGGLTL